MPIFFHSFLKFTDLGQLIILAHHLYSSPFVLIDEVKEITTRNKNTVLLKPSWKESHLGNPTGMDILVGLVLK